MTTPPLDSDDVLRVLVEKLAEKRLRASDLFRKLDQSGDGTLEPAELRAGFAEMGFKPTDEEFAALMKKFDRDGGGDVSQKEFDRAIKAAEKLGPRKKEVKEVKPKQKKGLTEEDMEEFKQIFCLFKHLLRTRGDDDGSDAPPAKWDESGTISVDELEQLLEIVGMRVEPGEFDLMIADMDKDSNGEIDFTEFCGKMAKQVQVPYSTDDIQKAFKSFAFNAPEGLIRVRDVRRALSTYMHKELTMADVDELLGYYRDCFVKFPGSDEEYFNYQDYVDIMTPIMPAGESEG